MSISLFKESVDALIDLSKNYTESVKAVLKSINRLISPFVPIEINDSLIASNTWTDGLSTETIELNGAGSGTLTRLLPLFDGTFLAVFSDQAALHYSANFSLMGFLPFKYDTTASSPNEKNYINVTDANVVSYNYIENNVNKEGSLLLVAMTALHIVQAYKYTDTGWSYVGMIGTVSTAGNGSSVNLSAPQAVTGYQNTGASSTTFTVLVGCAGAAASTATSFIKKVTLTISGSSSGHAELSFPGQYSVSNMGSLKNSETDRVKKMFMASADLLWLTSEAKTEFGALKLGTSVANRTLFMTSGNIKELAYDDILANPVSFAVDTSNVYVGDINGHIAKLSIDLKTVVAVMGKPKNVSSPANYPNEFKRVDDLILQGNTLYIVSGNNVYKSNFPALDSQEVIYMLNPQPATVRVEKLFGLADGTVELSIDGTKYYPLEYFAIRPIAAGTSIYVKVSRNLTDALKPSGNPLRPGVLLVSV